MNNRKNYIINVFPYFYVTIYMYAQLWQPGLNQKYFIRIEVTERQICTKICG